jgi:hypothetical protein
MPKIKIAENLGYLNLTKERVLVLDSSVFGLPLVTG